MNIVCLVGNSVTDVETREFGENTKASFRLAHNKKFGEKERSIFVDVECWGKLAEVVAKFVDKGKKVSVVGELRQDTWEDDSGNKRQKIYVNANEIQFLSPKSDGSSNSGKSKSSGYESPASDDDDLPF